MLSFPRVPAVAEDEPLRSRDVAAMARALKARDLSGLGNTVWRRVMWVFNAFRAVRNPDADGLNFPTMGEFFEIYQHLNPSNNPPTPRWPETGPGDPEGLNLACIMNGFVFGGSNFDAEQFRIGDGIVPLWNGPQPPSTTLELWELGKLQRGVIDPIEGVQNVPAIEAAQSGQLLTSGGVVNPHGKAWGGLFPAPVELSASCGASLETGATIPSYQILFTGLAADVSTSGFHGTISTNGDGFPVITYAGTCPIDTDDVANGHVLNIIRYPKQYAVAVYWDGGVVWDILPGTDWIEGPYTGNGFLVRQDGGHVSRALWAFIKDFRGTEAQRNPDDFNIQELAFDFETFLSNQYHLSPNRGTYNGFEIQANYPTAKIIAEAGEAFAAGTALGFGSTFTKPSHTYADGFVLTGYMLKSENLANSVSVEILSGESIIGRATLSPVGPAIVKYFEAAITPNPLSVRLATKARFSDAGSITFEATELIAYTPDHWDAYLVLRLGATGGGFESEGTFLDGSGVDQSAAKAIFDNYARYGCIVNTVAAGVRSIESYASENPVYDAMRRLTRDFTRIVQRRQFLSYEVSGGKATLRFKRWAYDLNEVRADYFQGIAPSWQPVSEVIEGEEYIVRAHAGGTINYGGKKLKHGKRFIGQRSVSTFEATGDAILLEYEGIKPTARKKGWTNEWCMFMNFHPVHPSDSSLWKTDAYGDYYTWNNPAHMYSPDMPLSLRRLATVYPTLDETSLLSPEVPDAFNYFGGANAGADADFCAAHPIYKAPYELESATVEFVESGDDVVRLVFKSMFQTHPDAPSTVNPDATTWDAGELSDLTAEDYRTDDNALREYVKLDQLGQYSPWKKGDDAFNSTLQSNPDNPFACCLPHFFFAKLPEEPYADGNDILDAHDSRVVIDNFMWWEIWLRAGCEGFVDGNSTQTVMCAGGGLPYDYIWENLTFDASGKRFIGDFVSGHGPMVNTRPLASLFNQYANAINLLTSVQVHRLLIMQTNTRTFEATEGKEPTWGAAFCPPNVGAAFYIEGCPPTPAFVSETGWVDGGSLDVSAAASAGQCGPGGEQVSFTQSKTEVEFRYVPIPGFENAVPESIQELAAAGSLLMWGNAESVMAWASLATTTDMSQTGCITSNGAFNFAPGEGYIFPVSSEERSQCMALSGGAISQGQAPCGTFAYCSQADPSSPPWSPIFKATSLNSFTFTKTSDDNAVIVVIPLTDEVISS